MSEEARTRKESGNNKDLGKEIVAYLSSLNLAITLFIVISALTALGTLIIQKKPLPFYTDYYGPRLGSFLVGIGFDDLFHSAIFNAILAVFLINLVACTMNKPFRKQRIGFYLAHFGVVLVFIGAQVGNRFGERGFAFVHEGQALTQFQTRDGTRIIALPFAVQVLDFAVDFDEPEGVLHVFAPGDSRSMTQGKVVAGQRVPLAGVPFEIRTLKAESRSTKGRAFMSAELEIEVDDKKRKVAIQSGDRSGAQAGNGYMLMLQANQGVKAYRSEVIVTQGGQQKDKATISVNHPMSYGGYHFYQSSYKQDARGDYVITGLEIVKDPGLGFAYLGMSMICIGVIWVAYLNPILRRRKKKSGEDESDEKNEESRAEEQVEDGTKGVKP